MTAYSCVIESPDGITWTQGYNDFDDLIDLKMMLGDDYLIVDIYSNE